MNTTYKDLCTRCIKCKEYIERYDTQQHYNIQSKMAMKWVFQEAQRIQIVWMYSLLHSRLMRFIFQRICPVKSYKGLFHTI